MTVLYKNRVCLVIDTIVSHSQICKKILFDNKIIYIHYCNFLTERSYELSYEKTWEQNYNIKYYIGD